jgi:hypothetical protein
VAGILSAAGPSIRRFVWYNLALFSFQGSAVIPPAGGIGTVLHRHPGQTTSKPLKAQNIDKLFLLIH